jgi:hypothetical protein
MTRFSMLELKFFVFKQIRHSPWKQKGDSHKSLLQGM